MNECSELPADLADASLPGMCGTRGTREVATLDNDFDIYRAADRKRLEMTTTATSKRRRRS